LLRIEYATTSVTAMNDRKQLQCGRKANTIATATSGIKPFLSDCVTADTFHTDVLSESIVSSTLVGNCAAASVETTMMHSPSERVAFISEPMRYSIAGPGGHPIMAGRFQHTAIALVI
jgi:hypothetical protein